MAPLQEMRNELSTSTTSFQAIDRPLAKKKWRRCFAALNLKIVGTCWHLRLTEFCYQQYPQPTRGFSATARFLAAPLPRRELVELVLRQIRLA